MSLIQKKRRVAITGLGAICGLGHNLNDIWSGLIQGKSGISQLSNINTDNLPIKIGGEIKGFKISESILPEKDWKKYDQFIHLSLHASNEALKMANLLDSNFYPKERIGCILGVGMGGFPFIEETHLTFIERGPKRVTPFFVPAVIPNMASGLISIQFGLKGINYTISSACASSGHALSAAAAEIESGRHEMMVTGGAESVFSSLPISGFASMKALSKRNDDPHKASRPFDLQRDGFVMGEGAGVLILEDLEKAQTRGATIYAELIGYGANSDANHITAPHPEGEGAARCMILALESANLKPEQIGYINAHGTSTPQGDIAETKAIKKVFNDYAYQLHISSTKSMTGHLLGAAAGVESIFTVLALHHGVLPPTINLEEPDSECDLNYIPNKAIEKKIAYALNNSFGFGGTNSSLIFKKYLET